MARARTLKPSFFKNEDLAHLGCEAQILFAGLWTLADRAGRLEDRPLRIKAEVFPYNNLNVEKLLNHLASTMEPFIVRYEVNGKRYIQIANFEKHQSPHVKEPTSTIPAPDLAGASMVPNVPFPLNPFPSPLSPNPTPQADFDFEPIWERYPNKDGKKYAREAFKSSVKRPEDYIDIQKALDNYLQSDKVRNGFIKNGSTWFGNWRDWIDFKGVPGGKNVSSHQPDRVTGFAGYIPGKYDGIEENARSEPEQS